MDKINKVHDFKMGDTIVFDASDDLSIYGKNDYFPYYSKFFKVVEGEAPENAIFSNESGKLHAIKPKLFTFICEHSPQDGHGLIMDMSIGHALEGLLGIPRPERFHPMVHLDQFRKATDEEC